MRYTKLKHLAVFALLAFCGACGTTFSLPEIDAASATQARSMFADAQSEGARVPLSVAAAERRFQRVARRVRPVAERFCEEVMEERPDFNCAARVEIDRALPERNAYFTYVDGTPVVRMTLPLLRDTQSDDEVAFVMGHEYGHLIGRHIEKQQQQQIAGALILGTIAAAANAQTAAYGGYTDPNLVNRSVELGAAIGTAAYSQTYELESDTLGTYITDAAGYDPVKGARYFARPEQARTESGKLSFWGTHPPDEKRIATVLATHRHIEDGKGLTRQQP
ncbi:M48 family metalloprotease [Tateyamaria sp. ANG-S1]|uniref:M48 family metalloprotease n=1 Tax=Tateyamaria sp. ANG-S1 TaxID=1577905 RepID=UPI00057D8616|nr:M48 family metalloprotease [Tateyamaria sp. ANG-S1]KIC46153.1 peptidase M48, Ste24p [Tateyamaria sp. ANG-S1]